MWSDAYDMRAACLLTFLILIIKMAIIWLSFTFFWFFCSSKRALNYLMLIKVAVVGSKEEAWELIKLDGSCSLGNLGPFFLIYSLGCNLSVLLLKSVCKNLICMYDPLLYWSPRKLPQRKGTVKADEWFAVQDLLRISVLGIVMAWATVWVT